ncbi:DeoR family transcriptional regulator [Pseudomonas chlororaphis]|uniref:DeoR family transcriptional regulator n=1 Tax=Pseudomonas chlororaphis TaxID=587753 RepID=UPI0003D33799|nr:DeoR family transcriptional regulator [Pseudomonas chlororaphis]AZD30679.1 Diaminopimelate epimerase [Pseudomonas chlororaphis]ETD38671.1 DeoR family transcriptional regulator [Pseudomonas chlororaphis subsp. aurantiaca PB-St2]QFS56040.1 diaminopimelate epimerase [Pseudomonas chlororaphis subsp. aurantiaca]
MTSFYDARGNLYGVVAPATVRELGIALPASAAEAALARASWSEQAIEALCGWAPGTRPAGAKAHRSDGLLVGPFQDAPPFDLLIVNTDGTLAERSGNGLTIFSQAMAEQGLLPAQGPTELRVHHDKADGVSPVATLVEPAQVAGVPGFWLDLGQPAFGAHAVGAQHGVEHDGSSCVELSRVRGLARLRPEWARSQFVRIGNPHCVTLVGDASALPSNRQMSEAPLVEALTRIAYAMPTGSGEPCPAGVNLQWAWLQGPQRIAARVFERGEGPTASSGTSASAVASAAWRVGWVKAGEVAVVMPGGTAPLRLEERGGELVRVSLFGTAHLIP